MVELLTGAYVTFRHRQIHLYTKKMKPKTADEQSMLKSGFDQWGAPANKTKGRMSIPSS